jgi:hypothetical protein
MPTKVNENDIERIIRPPLQGNIIFTNTTVYKMSLDDFRSEFSPGFDLDDVAEFLFNSGKTVSDINKFQIELAT